MASKKNRRTPDPIEEFKERQDYTHNPGKFTGGNLSPSVWVLGRWPLAMILLGMLGAAAVFVSLVTAEFHLFDLVYYLPGLAVSALLVFGGIGRLKNKRK